MASKQFEEIPIVKEVGKQENTEKPAKDHKDQKDSPDVKQHKDVKDQKDGPDSKHHKGEKEKEKEKEKEVDKPHFEKVHAEIPIVQTQAAAALSAGAQKIPEKSFAEKVPDTKYHKLEIKESKLEKFEFKELKDHKLEFKEHKNEKLEFEIPGGSTDPGGPVEQRLAALEATVAQLQHFIPASLRPDLTQGALKQEPDPPQGASATKPADPQKKPKG